MRPDVVLLRIEAARRAVGGQLGPGQILELQRLAGRGSKTEMSEPALPERVWFSTTVAPARRSVRKYTIANGGSRDRARRTRYGCRANSKAGPARQQA